MAVGDTPGLANEAGRRRELKRHKAGVTALLAVAAAIYLAAEVAESRGAGGAWLGYVSAAAEAGMVGGLADWFAVTALFRRPLGLPIPHTALIPRKKDQLGDALTGFVRDNFLKPDLVTNKVEAAGLPREAGRWLAERPHAEQAAATIAALARRALAALNREAIGEAAFALASRKAAEPTWAPPLGRGLEQFHEAGKTEPLIQAFLDWALIQARGSRDTIVSLVEERRPSWAPRFLDGFVGDRVYREAVRWLGYVASNAEHPARVELRRRIRQLAWDLQRDPETIVKVEEWKREALSSAAVRDAFDDALALGWEALDEALAERDSPLRRRLADDLARLGGRLAEGGELSESANRRLAGAVRYLAERYGAQLTGIISETVRGWDAREATDKMELLVGKDLQFIRLNGTIVGALAGLVIYTVTQILV